MEDLEVAAPAYKHFCEALEKQKYEAGSANLNISYHRLNTDFPQYFHYDRHKYLVSKPKCTN